MKNKFSIAISLAVIMAMLVTSVALASDVAVAVVDVTVPTNSVTLAPGTSGAITINMTVTGNQAGTATFEVYRDWVLSGGTFTGSNPQEFTVPPRAAQDPATTFSASGTVTVAVGQTPGGPFTLAVSAFDITNSNTTGAKLADGADSDYKVTVSAPSDTTPPVITPSVSGTLGSNGWYVIDVTVSWSVVDNESAISSSSGCTPTTINSDTAGITLTCSATSAGGTSSQSVTLMRDATAPGISGSAAPAPNGAGWNNTGVNVTFVCSDGMSGIASCGPDQTLSGEGSSQSATGTATDMAGNSTSATVSGINIDLTTPTISGVASPAANSYGWNNTDVTVFFTCGDGLSGVKSCGPDQTLSGEGAAQFVTGVAVDNADNSTSATVSGINIDLTAPSVVWDPGVYADGSVFYFGFVPAYPPNPCAAADALSGQGACTVTGFSTAVGLHTLTATAYDLAGNSTVETRSYEVKAWTLNGFFQPVDMNGVYNVVKNGSTVPLKFEIFAGSTELTDTAYVKSLTYTQTACSATATTDEIETTATGGTVLRYNATSGQFIFNWKTPNTAGKCYRVTMTTQDGSSLVAYFKLK